MDYFNNDKPLVDFEQSDDSFGSDDQVGDSADSFSSVSEEPSSEGPGNTALDSPVDSPADDAEQSMNFAGSEKETNPVSSNDELDWNYENTADEPVDNHVSHDDDYADAPVPKLSFNSNQPMVTVSVDWVELEGALENNSPELHSFISKETGDVIRVFRGSEDADGRL